MGVKSEGDQVTRGKQASVAKSLGTQYQRRLLPMRGALFGQKINPPPPPSPLGPFGGGFGMNSFFPLVQVFSPGKNRLGGGALFGGRDLGTACVCTVERIVSCN